MFQQYKIRSLVFSGSQHLKFPKITKSHLTQMTIGNLSRAARNIEQYRWKSESRDVMLFLTSFLGSQQNVALLHDSPKINRWETDGILGQPLEYDGKKMTYYELQTRLKTAFFKIWPTHHLNVRHSFHGTFLCVYRPVHYYIETCGKNAESSVLCNTYYNSQDLRQNFRAGDTQVRCSKRAFDTLGWRSRSKLLYKDILSLLRRSVGDLH